jgi:hypothetical protein
MQMMNPRSQTKSLDWMYEEQDEDFLLGKTPHEIVDLWEEEE